MPSFDYETPFWESGQIVAGADEVGRGAFAGPVVASTVVLAPIFNDQFSIFKQKIVINDSKKLNIKQREIADIWIRKNAVSFGIGEASVDEINKFGILKAIHKAYRRSVKNCSLKIDSLLLDAFYVPNVGGIPKSKQVPIIKGDSHSFSIAAASIIAKVYRDSLMQEYAKLAPFKKYFWRKNVGYGTRAHREQIVKHGTTKLHRKQFVETFLTRASSRAQSYA